jgi:hypothetical protein
LGGAFVSSSSTECICQCQSNGLLVTVVVAIAAAAAVTQLGVSRYIHATFRPKQRLPSRSSQARLNQHHCFSARDKNPFFPRVRPEISRFLTSAPAVLRRPRLRCSRSTNHCERRQTSLVRKSNPTTDGKFFLSFVCVIGWAAGWPR